MNVSAKSVAGLILVGIAAAAGASTLPPPHHRVHIEGEGPRTVVLESGFGDTLDIWQTIQPEVAANCARTFSYNRAGYLDLVDFLVNGKPRISFPSGKPAHHPAQSPYSGSTNGNGNGSSAHSSNGNGSAFNDRQADSESGISSRKKSGALTH